MKKNQEKLIGIIRACSLRQHNFGYVSVSLALPLIFACNTLSLNYNA